MRKMLTNLEDERKKIELEIKSNQIKSELNLLQTSFVPQSNCYIFQSLHNPFSKL